MIASLVILFVCVDIVFSRGVPDQPSRIVELSLARPDLGPEELRRLATRSSIVNEHLAREGLEGEEIKERLSEYRKSVVVTEQEIREFHRARQDLFGDRPFAECRAAAEKMIRLQRTMEALEGGHL